MIRKCTSYSKCTAFGKTLHWGWFETRHTNKNCRKRGSTVGKKMSTFLPVIPGGFAPHHLHTKMHQQTPPLDTPKDNYLTLSVLVGSLLHHKPTTPGAGQQTGVKGQFVPYERGRLMELQHQSEMTCTGVTLKKNVLKNGHKRYLRCCFSLATQLEDWCTRK